MSKCTEVYIYKINVDKVNEFYKIKDTLIQEANSLDGLISSTTKKSFSEENVFIDIMKWESLEHAKKGLNVFRALPTTEKFMSLMEGPPVFGGQFQEFA